MRKPKLKVLVVRLAFNGFDVQTRGILRVGGLIFEVSADPRAVVRKGDRERFTYEGFVPGTTPPTVRAKSRKAINASCHSTHHESVQMNTQRGGLSRKAFGAESHGMRATSFSSSVSLPRSLGAV